MRAASREKNQMPGPLGPMAYVRRFISGNVRPSVGGNNGGRSPFKRNGVRLSQALPSYVSMRRPGGKRGCKSAGSHDQWKKLISCQRCNMTGQTIGDEG